MTDYSIVLCGAAGQGIQTIEYALTRVLKLSGYNIFATKEYMSRVRGGSNSTGIRISDKPVQSFVEKIDLLIPLDEKAVKHLEGRISRETLIVGEPENAGGRRITEVSFSKIAGEIGDRLYENMVACGLVAGLLDADFRILEEFIGKRFKGKGEDVVSKNIEAAKAGRDLSRELGVVFKVEKDSSVKEQVLATGAEAIGLGAVAGGCDFISAYPMSPSTAVLAFLAQHGHDFKIIAEQAEDEISAINMALGASYAGARAMTNTSGGGFALMQEGVSLAGMTETPIVVHVAQRPGPATGLPTRTGQEDLNLVLYSGHGEFPRIILAPGNISQGFELARKAFELADRHQSPVFILTDQHFMDSYYNTDLPDLADISVKREIVESDGDYRRYEITGSGVSPRSLPGYGDGVVCADSDEHDEEGRITESMQVRVRMNDKRMEKVKGMLSDFIGPEIMGDPDSETAVVCWGSTRNAVREAVEKTGCKIMAVHFSQLYPIPASVKQVFAGASEIFVVENNASGQFADLLEKELGITVDEKILKYDGMPFNVEELADRLRLLGN